jgi:hypothetical protein
MSKGSKTDFFQDLFGFFGKIWKGGPWAKAVVILLVVFLTLCGGFSIVCGLGHETPTEVISGVVQIVHPADKMKKCEEDYAQWKGPKEPDWKDLSSEEKIEKCNEFETLDSNEKRTLASSSNKWSEGI